MKNIARGEVPIWLEHHFQGKGHMQQTYTTAGVKRIDPRSLGGALFQKRPFWRMLHANSSVITDLLHGIDQLVRAESKKVGRHDVIVFLGSRPEPQAISDDIAQANLARFSIVPKQ